jgi:cytoskeletal protein CcmA (bactofilin family)
MFSKSKPSQDQAINSATRPRDNPVRSSGHTFSMIAADVQIVGNVSAKVDLHIDGKIQGDVTCGSLVQGTDSVITGKVVAETARLSGQIDGSIEAGELIIEASARIKGDVTYESLNIAPGGQVEGKFKHKSAAPNIRKATVEIANSEPLVLGNEARVA